jgi:membrane dipeptidase
MRMGDIAHQEFVIRGESLDDLTRAKEKGQIAFIASLEAATAIENEVDRLDILYGLGIRSSGIAYSEANALGSGLREGRDGGPQRVRTAGGPPHEQARHRHRRLAFR